MENRFKKQNLLAFFFMLLFFVPSFSYADCAPLRGQELIDHSDLIFEGRPLFSQRHWFNTLTFGRTNYYTEFESLNVIKGKVKNIKKISIHYRYSPKSSFSPAIKRHPYTLGEYYLVFSDFDEDYKHYRYSISCSTPALSFDKAYIRGASSQFTGDFKSFGVLGLLYEKIKYPRKEELFERLKLVRQCGGSLWNQECIELEKIRNQEWHQYQLKKFQESGE